MKKMKKEEIEIYLNKLGEVYASLGGEKLTLGICGGAALAITGLIPRTTKDIDLLFPLNLPKEFFEARTIVAKECGLSEEWINLGPKDLTIMGLPNGLEERAIRKTYGKSLETLVIARIDQIFFKVYASADRAGYHVQDLLALKPTDMELKQAVSWCTTHDASEEFRIILKSMMEQLGFSDVAKSI